MSVASACALSGPVSVMGALMRLAIARSRALTNCSIVGWLAMARRISVGFDMGGLLCWLVALNARRPGDQCRPPVSGFSRDRRIGLSAALLRGVFDGRLGVGVTASARPADRRRSSPD